MAKNKADKYKAQFAKTDANKARRARKREQNKEKWANDKEYIKQQNEKGYFKIDGKWRKARKEKAANANI